VANAIQLNVPGIRDIFVRCDRILAANKDIGGAVEEQGRNRELVERNPGPSFNLSSNFWNIETTVRV
jgi:hypothetical protein